MNSLFHHSLIKIIFLHHLKQLNIPWENFIEIEVFTSPPNQLARPITPSTSVTQKETRSSRRVVVKKSKEVKTYQIGYKQVFSPKMVEGALPSTSANQGYHKQHETSFQEKEALHHEIKMVDLESQDEQENLNLVIKEKYAKIRELQDNLASSKFVISFLK